MDKEFLEKRLLTSLCLERNEYFEKYTNLILENISRKPVKFLTERHHIIPSYYYKDLGIKKDNSVDNVVNLTFKDHVLAHYYLSQCSVGKYKYSNYFSVLAMVGRKEFPLSEDELMKELPLYEEIRKQSLIYMSKMMSGRCVPPDVVAKSVKNRSGYRHSENTIQNIRNSNIGKKHNLSEEGRQKISSTRSGSHWYNNGLQELCFFENDAIPEGFVKGRLRISEETREKLCVSQQKRFQNNSGTMLGRKLTLEQRKRLSQSLSGRKIPVETVTKLSNTLKGSKMYTNGTVTVRVLKGEEPPEGFFPGMPRKNSSDIASTNLEEL